MNGDLNTFGFVREGMAYRPEVRMVDACQIDWEIDGSVEIKQFCVIIVRQDAAKRKQGLSGLQGIWGYDCIQQGLVIATGEAEQVNSRGIV